MVSYKSYQVHIYVYCYVLGKDHPVGRVHLYMAAVFDVANFFTAKKGSPEIRQSKIKSRSVAEPDWTNESTTKRLMFQVFFLEFL